MMSALLIKNMAKTEMNKRIYPGHNACAGCGQLVAVQAVMRALGNEKVIIANATGCLEVTTTAYPQTAWGLPWLHSLFENPSSLASGIKAALKKQKKDDVKVIVQAGDGGTFDIGLGLISGAWERGDNFIYICYDTEAYSNTGVQASGSTPLGASTTTSPNSDCPEVKTTCPLVPGSTQAKKDMLAIALAHGLKYVAQASAGYPDDITRKIKKALAVDGPSYIQIFSPCVLGWKTKYDEAVNLGKLAVQTGLYPLLEYENGQLMAVSKLPANNPKVEEYLKLQGRYSHLLADSRYQSTVSLIQKTADNNISKYGLR